MPTTGFEALLRERGLRVTAIRLAILQSLEAAPHAQADTVLALVRQQLGTASVQAVYDALHALTEHKLINTIEPAGHPARYELRVGDNHHHLICTGCGRIEDVDCSIGHAPCLAPSDSHGFHISVAEVNYWGLCQDCAHAQKTADLASPPSWTPVAL